MSSDPLATFDEDTNADPIKLRDSLLRIATLEWRAMQSASDDACLEGATAIGRFEGLPPHVALLDDGRRARLLTDLTFFHDDWQPWPVSAGIEVDGASIPRPLWGLIGGPFEGKYRNASIVHDHYCVTRDRPWRHVHRMFYEAMLASSVGTPKAKVMYYAVYRFGPRWADTGLESRAESAGVRTGSRLLSDAQAESLAADAEAIYFHGLSVDEIDRLAEARDVQPDGTLEALETTAVAAARESARKLVIVGGRGDATDHAAVVEHAAHLPEYLLERFKEKGVRIVGCRDSVTDFETSLKKVTPRGWESTGKTWDHVPGAYFPDKKRVVIATVAGAGGDRIVPGKASGLHGSSDLVVHESLHGYDYIGGHAVLYDPRFDAARKADSQKLGAYERQDGQAGLEETFAESGARFHVEPEAMATEWPQLHAYWRQGPSGDVDVPRETLESSGSADAPIGAAEILEGGAIAIDLRAEGPGGAVGHAWFTVANDDPDYQGVKAQLFGGEEGLESLAEPGSQALILP